MANDPRVAARALPLTTRFELGLAITPIQHAFLDLHGFLLFSRVASPEEVERLGNEARAVQNALLREGRTSVRGVPLIVGTNFDNEPYVQRIPFTSIGSEWIRNFIRDSRFDPVRDLVGVDARVGDEEKDGVVFNTYYNAPGSLRPRLGWHTDGIRSLFYGRLPGPMLNVGLHLDEVTTDDGGLRLIPGSHTQGFWSMCFRKPYFIGHTPDPDEIAIETRPGDLTVHDGRMWHRVAASPHTGRHSLRRSMYVPYITDAYSPKDEDSTTPVYHRVFQMFLGAKRRLTRRPPTNQ